MMTPHKELALIRAGNPSASLAFGGVVVGLAIPLGSCLAHSFGVWDLHDLGRCHAADPIARVPLRRHVLARPAAPHR
jgi:hypothetical protein